MVTLRFDVPGIPVPKARARVGRRGGFTPKRTADYTRVVRDAASLMVALLGREWDTNAAHYRLTVYVVPLAPKKQRGPDELRGDWDNYGKLVSDALNGVAWKDDRAVVDARVVVCVPTRQPGIRVSVERVERPCLADTTTWPEHHGARHARKATRRKAA